MGKLWFDFKRGNDDVNEAALLDLGTRRGLVNLMTERLATMGIRHPGVVVAITKKQTGDGPDGPTYSKMGLVDFKGSINEEQVEDLAGAIKRYVLVWRYGFPPDFAQVQFTYEDDAPGVTVTATSNMAATAPPA